MGSSLSRTLAAAAAIACTEALPCNTHSGMGKDSHFFGSNLGSDTAYASASKSPAMKSARSKLAVASRRILEDGTGSPEQGKSFDGTLSIDEVCAAFDAAWEAGSARGLLELLETEEVLYESIWEVNRTNNQVRLWRATGDRRGA